MKSMHASVRKAVYGEKRKREKEKGEGKGEGEGSTLTMFMIDVPAGVWAK